MEDSVAYQSIVSEGERKGLTKGLLEEARAILLQLGLRKIKTIDDDARLYIEALTDLERLEQLTYRVLAANNWSELLDDDQ